MNKPDPTEVLNENISYLVNTMKLEINEIGLNHDFTLDQISEMEKDFIARLAFTAIKYGDKKEGCESCPAKDHCSFKEPEKKSDDLDEFYVETLSVIKDYCMQCTCDNCRFSEDHHCKLKYTPNEWRI